MSETRASLSESDRIIDRNTARKRRPDRSCHSCGFRFRVNSQRYRVRGGFDGEPVRWRTICGDCFDDSEIVSEVDHASR